MATIRIYDELPFGFSWVLDEALTRTSHALVDDGRVWIVDPVDVGDAIERSRALGQPAAVLQLLDRHRRDCASVARRLGVPHIALPHELPGTPLQPLRVVSNRLWREVALWWPARAALVVAEAVGTNRTFTVGVAPVGVHVGLRLTPPRALGAHAPEHLLVGHGPGVHGPAAARALADALDRSRKDLPRALWHLPGALRG